MIIGVDHVELGRMVSEHWRFPPMIRSVVELHHTPWPLPVDATRPDAQELMHLVALVQVADSASKESLFEQPPAGDDVEIRIDISPEELLERIHETEALIGN